MASGWRRVLQSSNQRFTVVWQRRAHWLSCMVLLVGARATTACARTAVLLDRVVVAWFVPVKSPPADLDNIIRDPTKGLAS